MAVFQTTRPRRLAAIGLALLLCLAPDWGVASAAPGTGHPSAAQFPGTFIQIATAPNIVGPATLIDYPALNGKPAALAFVTANRTPPAPATGAAGDHALGLVYDSTAGRWTVVNQDSTAMSVGTALNVQAIITPTAVFQHTVPANNVDSFTMFVNPLSNDKPNALVFVTFNGSLGGGPAPANPHPLAVFYDPVLAQWGVFNQDGRSLPGSAGFNVMVREADAETIVHQATAANTSGSQTTLDLAPANGDPAAIILVTPNWNPGGLGGQSNPHNVGVRYDAATGRWAIFNEDGAAMPLDAAFNVLAYGQGKRHLYLPLLSR